MMDSTELNTRSLSLKYVFIRLDGILLVGGSLLSRSSELLAMSLVLLTLGAGCRKQEGYTHIVIHFKLYISSFTIISSEDDICVNERKSEIIILSRFVVVQLFHIYIDHDHFCTCIKNSNHSRPLLILGILAYDRRKLYCFHGNKNFLLLYRTCTILVEI